MIGYSLGVSPFRYLENELDFDKSLNSFTAMVSSKETSLQIQVFLSKISS